MNAEESAIIMLDESGYILDSWMPLEITDDDTGDRAFGSLAQFILDTLEFQTQ